ncbi:RnfABCDGE type electron transport complex subunit D [Fenollaria massiliensis]|uniref:Ion-translocating oxidoreductase complex subunit D n=1 Tax=Fenollaria massiliensis TaxID=938288 RepID=A0A9E7DIF8_9FIRM|nr:RnfABCDGE type electron transport complex subunit D [Fenollaria massiliensis]UQK58560.1 RnfABCDGE type electron transport complex subunit D [Fenollaria massiliensis]
METNKNVQSEKLYRVSLAPYLRSKSTTQKMMLDVIIAMLPALAASIYFFGMNALMLTVVSVISCVVAEVFMQKLFKKKVTVSDLSAVITGILLAFNLPASAPWWMPVFGGFFAICIAKQIFGGIGSNFMNPALAARAAIMASWPGLITNYITPDGVASATPLQLMKAGTTGELPSLMDMAIGNIGGVIGETCSILLVLGGIYLIVKKVIDWKIPCLYILTTTVLLAAFGVDISLLPYHILGGGLILGAFFMATDFVTCPVTPNGRIIFAIGCGIITAIIRVYGGMAEGVSYAIILMNTATPLIESLTTPKVFGEVKSK